MKGVVKFYNKEKSFGFIKVEKQKDIFFHKSSLSNGYIPQDEDKVEFDAKQTDRGMAAENVCKAQLVR
jgi:CspA family cold shock protein